MWKIHAPGGFQAPQRGPAEAKLAPARGAAVGYQPAGGFLRTVIVRSCTLR